MELLVQVVLAIGVFGVTLSGGSLLWPRITTSPRPQLLQEVHDSVIKTPAGESAARVLGVSDEANITPINLGEIAGGAALSLKNAATKRVQTIIMSQVTGQLQSRYENLSADQQLQIQQIVCPSSASGVIQ